MRRLNTLFGQVTQAMDAQRTLISNAAHQLRNPIAGILAMAEGRRSAPDGDAARAPRRRACPLGPPRKATLPTGC